MKKVTMLLALAALFAGCSTGKIIIKHDDFKNADIISMELNHSPQEFMWAAYANADYVREIDSKGAKPTVINMAMRAAAESPNLEPKAFLKADDQNYEISFFDITGETHTEVSESVNYSKKGGKEVTSDSAKIFRAKLSLTAEIEKKILESSKLVLRIYLGKHPSTYTISKDDLDKIKKFLTAKPGDQKK